MDFLTEIIALKRERLARAKAVCGVDAMCIRAEDVRRDASPRALSAALKNSDGLNVIAEFKRASPSKGVIRARAAATQIALAYERGGAAAISVLTEEDRFQGSLDDLSAVRAAVKIPVLRKDFIFDEYQPYESAAAGADALLLIVAALDDETLARLRRITEEELKMDALVEVHTEEELRRAESSGATLIGVNNRDLHSFNVSLEVSVNLAGHAPADALLVAESGLRSTQEIRRLRALGYRGFLIGETLMRAEEPEQALRELISETGENAESRSQKPEG